MSHLSPTVFQLWSILATFMTLFFLVHIYLFDRFQCFKWSRDHNSANFKRFMIYTYALSLPCVLTFSIGFAVIKTSEGFIPLPNFSLFPKPSTSWSPSHEKAILPLYLVFSLGWGLEFTTHLEELCFWLFLLKSRTEQDWFKTHYFKIWAVGSILFMPSIIAVTASTRKDSLKCEAYTFLTASICGLVLTAFFIPILYRFPAFLRRLKNDGIDHDTIVRLTKFHELNVIRVFFRFLFFAPLLILSSDGVRGAHSHINENLVWTDTLGMLAGVGCAVSSYITVMIFFPRSIEAEISRAEAAWTRRLQARSQSKSKTSATRYDPAHVQLQTKKSLNNIPSSHVRSFGSVMNVGYDRMEEGEVGMYRYADADAYGDDEVMEEARPASIPISISISKDIYESEAPQLSVSNLNTPNPELLTPSNAQFLNLSPRSSFQPTIYSEASIPEPIHRRSYMPQTQTQTEIDNPHRTSNNLTFPLTSHNLALHTTLETTRGRNLPIHTFRSPIDVLT